MNIFKRKSSYFTIDDKIIKLETTIQNALYAAVYEEFRGAVNNSKYKNLTNLQRIQELNKYAENWLKDRGLL